MEGHLPFSERSVLAHSQEIMETKTSTLALFLQNPVMIGLEATLKIVQFHSLLRAATFSTGPGCVALSSEKPKQVPDLDRSLEENPDSLAQPSLA